MKCFSITSAVLCLLAAVLNSQAQGFVNLDFEAADIFGYSPASFGIPTTNALPGWIAYEGNVSGGTTNNDSQIWYDGQSIGAQMISINDTNRGSGFTPLQGQFTVSLNGIIPNTSPPFDYFTAIGQIGEIPVGTQSLTFFAGVNVTAFDFQVTFAGQDIPMTQIGSAANYAIYGGDVSVFGGQTGELLFTALPQHGGLLDNIQFSTSPIPEPTVFSLFALGGLLIGCRQWRKSKR
jgi:hypothetical protein